MSVRKAIFWLHLISGVLAGIVILVMSATGLVLAYERQVTTWADGIKITPPAADAPRVSMTVLLANARSTQSNAVPSAVVVRSNPNAPVSISFGKETTVFANPYTGELIAGGGEKTRAFFHTITSLHRYLGAEGDGRAVGKGITGAANLVFLFLVLSGVVIWWPRKWSLSSLKAITLFKGGLQGKARDWNWHNVFGFWAALPLVFIVSSAVVISYPWASDLVYRITGNEPPPARPSGSQTASGSGKREGGKESRDRSRFDKPTATAELNWQHFDKMLEQAQAQVPGWQSITLRTPSSAEAPFVFTIDRGAGARPDLRSQLTLDAKTGDVVSYEAYSSQNSGKRLRSWVRWVHTGEAGGIIGQTIAALASAAALFLVWTGLALSWRRFFGRKVEEVVAGQVQSAVVSAGVK